MKHTVAKILLILVLVACLLFGTLATAFAEEAKQSEMNQLLSDIQGLMTKYGPEIPQEVRDGTKLGTFRHYQSRKNSYYVAIGDNSIRKNNESYADLLAADLAVPYKKLAQNDLLMEQVSEEILQENISEIKKADLITLNLSVNSFAKVAVNEIMGSDGSADLDWDKYVSKEGVAEIKETLARLRQYLSQSGVSGPVSSFLPGVTKENALVTAAECFAYGTLAYTKTLPEVLDEIHAINSKARIVVVGMDNPLSGAAIKLSSGEAMELGSYVEKLIKMIDDCAQSAALERQYVTFVSAPNAANDNDGKTLTESNLILAYLNNVKAEAMPNEKGHAYIMEQIRASFRKLGDVDGNGAVNYRDALKVLRASIKLEDLDADALLVGDVDGKAGLSYRDALKILRASIGLESLGPEEDSGKHDNMTDLG